MLTDRSYWGALSLFGLAVILQGAARLLGTSPAIADGVTVLAGLLVCGAAVNGLVRGVSLEGNADSTLIRLLSVTGAVLYAAMTMSELVL